MFRQCLLGCALILFSSIAKSAVTDCAANSFLAQFASSAYGERIEFDVYRNDKLVGEHVTRFSNTDKGLRVSSNMNLTVKVLFVPVYEFEYNSNALWCNETLQSLQAFTNRNGDVTQVALMTGSKSAVIEMGDRVVTAPADIVPTNHWNPAVLDRQQVFNTITGGVNSVDIVPCASGSELIELAAPAGACYQYSGELQTRAWYDEQKRWVGLEFEGSDGSTISYVCRSCIR